MSRTEERRAGLFSAETENHLSRLYGAGEEGAPESAPEGESET